MDVNKIKHALDRCKNEAELQAIHNYLTVRIKIIKTRNKEFAKKEAWELLGKCKIGSTLFNSYAVTISLDAKPKSANHVVKQRWTFASQHPFILREYNKVKKYAVLEDKFLLYYVPKQIVYLIFSKGDF